MKINKNFIISVFTLLLVSCGTGESVSQDEHDSGPFYVEFVSCTKGNGFSKTALSEMLDAWRALPISDELRGSYFYDPLNEENAFGPSMWWELEWDTKDSAKRAWQSWTQDASVAEWTEKYSNVMSCDGSGRNAWDIIIPVSSTHFGGSNDSGYFYSQYWTCSYTNEAGSTELQAFLPTHADKIKESNLEGSGYHYGVYLDRRTEEASHSDVAANFVWGEWARSSEAMEEQNQNFTENFQDVFSAFEQIGACQDNPDLFDSWILYSRENQEYSPTF